MFNVVCQSVSRSGFSKGRSKLPSLFELCRAASTFSGKSSQIYSIYSISYYETFQ